jgi:hypothetical protein
MAIKVIWNDFPVGASKFHPEDIEKEIYPIVKGSFGAIYRGRLRTRDCI